MKNNKKYGDDCSKNYDFYARKNLKNETVQKSALISDDKAEDGVGKSAVRMRWYGRGDSAVDRTGRPRKAASRAGRRRVRSAGRRLSAEMRAEEQFVMQK